MLHLLCTKVSRAVGTKLCKSKIVEKSEKKVFKIIELCVVKVDIGSSYEAVHILQVSKNYRQSGQKD